MSSTQHDARTSLIECEIYDPKNCTKGTDCNKTTVKFCDNAHENCYVVWKNVNKDGVNVTEVHLKGCFTNNVECNQTECVDRRENIEQKNLNYCCCKENRCNHDFTWIPTPTEAPAHNPSKKFKFICFFNVQIFPVQCQISQT